MRNLVAGIAALIAAVHNIGKVIAFDIIAVPLLAAGAACEVELHKCRVPPCRACPRMLRVRYSINQNGVRVNKNLFLPRRSLAASACRALYIHGRMRAKKKILPLRDERRAPIRQIGRMDAALCGFEGWDDS